MSQNSNDQNLSDFMQAQTHQHVHTPTQTHLVNILPMTDAASAISGSGADQIVTQLLMMSTAFQSTSIPRLSVLMASHFEPRSIASAICRTRTWTKSSSRGIRDYFVVQLPNWPPTTIEATAILQSAAMDSAVGATAFGIISTLGTTVLGATSAMKNVMAAVSVFTTPLTPCTASPFSCY